jgi:glycosyltransferase involved in cell wall biosynthesis
MNKQIDIIYFGNILDVNGVNFVTNAFVLGKDYFKENNLYLNKIYSSTSIIDCSELDSIPIGMNVGSRKYKMTRIIRSILKKIFDSRIPILAWFKFYQNHIKPGKKVISKYSQNLDNDYVIFQDFITAYYYYKNLEIKHKKSILILHSEEEVFRQFMILYPGIFKGRYKNLLYSMIEFAKEKVDRIVYVSERALTRNENGKDNISYIHNGLPDLDQFNFKSTNSIINFVCIGSINYNKGQDVIIEAVNLLSDNVRERSCFFFVGDGPQASELRKKIKEYGLENNIKLLGIRSDVTSLLKDMDVLLLPSKTEGLPLCIIEGLRQGLYIVATDVGGISEMVSDEFGDLITRDKIDLKYSIEKIILDNKVNQESKMASRRYYENKFSLKMMIDKYSETLKSI